jgi:hypothetical protein
MGGRPDKEMAFVFASLLSYLRPDRFLRIAFPTPTQLRAAVFGAVKLGDPEFAIPGADCLATMRFVKYAEERLLDVQYMELSTLVRQFGKPVSATDIDRWVKATELTADRVGLILCGSIETAAREIADATTGQQITEERVKELLVYGVSEEYFDVRARLGLAIGTPCDLSRQTGQLQAGGLRSPVGG